MRKEGEKERRGPERTTSADHYDFLLFEGGGKRKGGKEERRRERRLLSSCELISGGGKQKKRSGDVLVCGLRGVNREEEGKKRSRRRR